MRHHKDGRLIDISATISPIRDASGAVIGASKIARDVTERLSLEAQLRESQKMEAIGTLAGGIAHDFNNIIAAILGNTELAREDVSASNGNALQSLDEIRKAATRARDLVQQILSFSRRQPIERKRIALSSVIEESVHLLRATLPARLSIEVNCDPAVASLDEAAVHARPGLAMLAARRPGVAVRLRLTDTGPGMDAATLARLFDPFFTTKPVGEGTGLGLSVVHGIALTHEGVILAESSPGHGATFSLYLPPAEAGGQHMSPVRGGSVAAPAAVGHGQRLLYIDDDEALVFLMARLLERRGFQVTGYTVPGEALEALRAEPARFDLVVTDYNMPGLSGLDVARAVRDIRADLPVAVASGLIAEELRIQADAAGVRELIFKASSVQELCEAFARVADRIGRPASIG
jgi:nitrogen-specific signal transduction histidine kinase/ActR/RegA family two-component response regulator